MRATMAATIPLRVKPSEREVLELAAQQTKTPISTYVRERAVEAARRDIAVAVLQHRARRHNGGAR